MGRYLVQDQSTRVHEIDESALPFWDHPGYTVIGPAPEPGSAPTADSDPADPPAPPEESGTSTTARKAAVRPAQNEGAGPR